MTKATKSNDFESRLEDLEKLVEKLEQGDLSLDDSLKAFEKGVSLTKSCLETLKKAELKVKKLETLSEDAELEDFPDNASK